MKQTEKINGVTVKFEVEKNSKRNHLTSFNSLSDMVKDMTSRDVIHKGANIGDDFYIVDLEKTDEANDNWYENEMRINDKHFPQPNLPTDMYK